LNERASGPFREIPAGNEMVSLQSAIGRAACAAGAISIRGNGPFTMMGKSRICAPAQRVSARFRRGARLAP
jgi:hypothetical protein